MFCETSTVLKYYLDEGESDAVRSRLDEVEEVVLSSLAQVEIMSGFYQRLCKGLWTRPQFLRMTGQFQVDSLQRRWSWVPVDEAVIEYSTNVYLRIPDDLFLRASDCVHIATALQSDHDEIYTHDVRLFKAAEVLGLTAVRIS